MRRTRAILHRDCSGASLLDMHTVAHYSRSLMNPSHAFASLNAAQREAATHGEPLEGGGVRAAPLLVIAGAGTGKTNTLAHRVAHLLLHGAVPERLLLLTFTRRAALEMTRRAQRVVADALSRGRGPAPGSTSLRLPWSGTFHAVGNR